ncbi:MAG: alpha/beta hydrolase [Pseudomonadales bacterium]|jgi:acetyl esterase/lipase|nr:alpha/beta hydrolase [Pseudomonadales bacterium]
MNRLALPILCLCLLGAAQGAGAETREAAPERTPGADPGPGVGFDAVLALEAPAPARTLSYGVDPLQYGQLWLPAVPGRAPVVVLIHGGCWLNAYGADHAMALAGALAEAGFAVWSLEYRRVGDPGGGWPGTGEDVLAGIDRLADLAEEAPVDLGRVALVGHSAGGHLALWAAGVLGPDARVRPRAVVGLAAITDPAAYALGDNSCEVATPRFMGGTPAQVPARYVAASPFSSLPSGVDTYLVQGDADAIVPPMQARAFAAAAAGAGQSVALRMLPGFGHFALIHPATEAFAVLRDLLQQALSAPEAGS